MDAATVHLAATLSRMRDLVGALHAAVCGEGETAGGDAEMDGCGIRVELGDITDFDTDLGEDGDGEGEVWRERDEDVMVWREIRLDVLSFLSRLHAALRGPVWGGRGGRWRGATRRRAAEISLVRAAETAAETAAGYAQYCVTQKRREAPPPRDGLHAWCVAMEEAVERIETAWTRLLAAQGKTEVPFGV